MNVEALVVLCGQFWGILSDTSIYTWLSWFFCYLHFDLFVLGIWCSNSELICMDPVCCMSSSKKIRGQAPQFWSNSCIKVILSGMSKAPKLIIFQSRTRINWRDLSCHGMSLAVPQCVSSCTGSSWSRHFVKRNLTTCLANKNIIHKKSSDNSISSKHCLLNQCKSIVLLFQLLSARSVMPSRNSSLLEFYSPKRFSCQPMPDFLLLFYHVSVHGKQCKYSCACNVIHPWC